ncbi:MAG: hypothetical protein ACE5HP_08395, partial [Gemmatimonadota bacterium]
GKRRLRFMAPPAWTVRPTATRRKADERLVVEYHTVNSVRLRSKGAVMQGRCQSKEEDRQAIHTVWLPGELREKADSTFWSRA